MKHPTPPRRKNQGFTLIEMLIVVAIIAILIAVSIPMVNNALERARVATDAANERAAKAEATIMFLDGELDKQIADDSDHTIELAYNAQEGKLVSGAEAEAIVGYGKCTQATHGPNGNIGNHAKMVVWTQVDKDGIVKVAWGTDGKTQPSWSTLQGQALIHGTDLTDKS